MLELSGVTGGWGLTVVIEGFDLTLKRGETLALLGRNGVGKSTLLELIVGRADLRAGSIRLGDKELARMQTYQRARSGIAYVPQGREVFPSLSVWEHLQVAQTPGAWTIARVLKMFPRLEERRASLGNQLSGGEQQMLAMARALLGNPSVLLLDEPFEGLAPVIVETLVRNIKQITEETSLAVLLVEQRVDIALDLSDRCVVMDRGKAVFEGRSEDLCGDEARVAALMGLGDAVPMQAEH